MTNETCITASSPVHAVFNHELTPVNNSTLLLPPSARTEPLVSLRNPPPPEKSFPGCATGNLCQWASSLYDNSTPTVALDRDAEESCAQLLGAVDTFTIDLEGHRSAQPSATIDVGFPESVFGVRLAVVQVGAAPLVEKVEVFDDEAQIFRTVFVAPATVLSLPDLPRKHKQR